MIENVLFFINLLKIAMNARRSVIIHQTSAFVIFLAETLLNYSAIFVGGDARFGFVPQCRVLPLRYILILTLWFMKGVKLYCIELSKPSFNYQQSIKKRWKNREKYFPKDNKWAFQLFFSHYMLNTKEEIYEYPLVIYRQNTL